MKIIVTGSLGNISKPLTIELLAKGHAVTVITRKADKQTEIEALGARVTIGSLEDVSFLTKTFTGADAVYLMKPPQQYVDYKLGLMRYYEKLGTIYKQAIEQSGIKRVVHLSSIGAHTNKGNGILAYHYHIEQLFKQIPASVSITHLRPVGFYYNLNEFADFIKGKGILAIMLALLNYGPIGLLQGKRGVMVSNYGGKDKLPWVSPIDIAAVAAEELTMAKIGRSIRYVASDELTCNEIAAILGKAIGKPYLRWGLISDKQMLSGMKSAGVPAELATGVVEMQAAQHNGTLYEDYYRNRPTLGKIKMTDFATEFAAMYRQKA